MQNSVESTVGKRGNYSVSIVRPTVSGKIVMEWREKSADLVTVALSDETAGMNAIDICSIVAVSRQFPLIEMDDAIWKQVETHLGTANTELGGLLLGRPVRLSRRPSSRLIAVVVTETIPSRDFSSTGVSLRMNTELWSEARLRIRGSTIVIGWYHSHPNLGAFFSGTDRATQSAVFYHDYSLGLVVDPLNAQWKWFIGGESREIPAYLVRRNWLCRSVLSAE
jgi:proteasome lid subunit RPN8/RPN11